MLALIFACHPLRRDVREAAAVPIEYRIAGIGKAIDSPKLGPMNTTALPQLTAPARDGWNAGQDVRAAGFGCSTRLGALFGSEKQAAGPSNQLAGSEKQAAGSSNQLSGSGKQAAGSSHQLAGSEKQVAESSNQLFFWRQQRLPQLPETAGALQIARRGWLNLLTLHGAGTYGHLE